MDIVAAANKKSKRTPCKYKVSAVCFDRRGKLLGIATNMPRFSKKGGGIHAEMAALQKWGVKVNKMMLFRFGAAGELKPIHPCVNCAKVLKKLDIAVIGNDK